MAEAELTLNNITECLEIAVKEVFPERNLKVCTQIDINKNSIRTQFDRNYLDITKIRNLGWNISFSLKEGFKRTVNYYEGAKK